MEINFTKITWQRLSKEIHTLYCVNDVFEIKLFREGFSCSVQLQISFSSRALSPQCCHRESRARSTSAVPPTPAATLVRLPEISVKYLKSPCAWIFESTNCNSIEMGSSANTQLPTLLISIPCTGPQGGSLYPAKQMLPELMQLMSPPGREAEHQLRK